MITAVEFKNFKVLRDTTLPLGRFTLIVGPNGSGKSTALQAMQPPQGPPVLRDGQVRTAGVATSQEVSITTNWEQAEGRLRAKRMWRTMEGESITIGSVGRVQGHLSADTFAEVLRRMQLFAFDAAAIGQAVPLVPNMELHSNGGGLAGVLDRLRDQHEERFEALNQELCRWLPEFSRVLFETPAQGQRAIALRTREGAHLIRAADLSQGTLIALAILTIAYLPHPPSVVCLEEPDHGLHPRLLRDVRDAISHLAYPEEFGEKREPVQVVATTHNPYFLDLFRDHPEEIVIAEKVGLEAKFSRLSDRTDLDEILGEAHLGEVWYSGVLGGVPVGT